MEHGRCPLLDEFSLDVLEVRGGLLSFAKERLSSTDEPSTNFGDDSGHFQADRTGREIVADGHSQRYTLFPEAKRCFQKAIIWERSGEELRKGMSGQSWMN